MNEVSMKTLAGRWTRIKSKLKVGRSISFRG